VADLRKGYWVELIPGERTDGSLAIGFVAKRTFTIPVDDAVIQPLEDDEQPPFLEEDRYDDGDAETAPPTLEHELVMEKGACDVIVVGKAHAPGGKPAPQFDCSLRVGTRKRTLRILGPRKALWVPYRKKQGKPVPQLPRFSDPEPIKTLPLSYVHAYGGSSWVIHDPETMRIMKEVNAVIDAENAEEAEKKAAQLAEKAKAEEKAKKEADEKAFLEEGVGMVSGEDEKLLRGDGSFGYDKEGVRKHDGTWGVHTSNDGTAIMDVEAFEQWQQTQAEKEAAAVEAAANKAAEKKSRKRKNAAGEFIEVDEGVEILDDDTLKAELEKSAAEQEEMRKAWADAAGQRAAESVLQNDGTRVFDASMIDQIDKGEGWEDDLQSELKDTDAEVEQERLAAIKERRKKLEEKLAEHPKLPCPTNPFGKGFLASHVKMLIDRLELPQIESPAAPLTPKDLLQDFMDLSKVPLPAGFSTYPRQARPRVDFAGAYPSDLVDWASVQDEQKRALDLEKDEDVQALREMDKRETPGGMDPRYFNSAPPDMHWQRIDGDEEIALENLSEDGHLFFRLPGKAIQAELDRGNGVERLDLAMDTLVIEPDERQVTMIWRGHYPLSSWDELETYPHMVGWVLDLDIKDKRKQDWEAASKKKEGTAMLDISELEEADEYWKTISDERKAKEAATMAAVEGTQALDIDRMGLYRQNEDEGWVKEASDGTVDEKALEQQKKDEEAYLEKKHAALKALEDKEAKEQDRREEVAEAVQAEKPIPPPDAKKTPKQLKAKAAKKAAAAKKAGGAAGGAKKAAGGAKKAAGGAKKAADGAKKAAGGTKKAAGGAKKAAGGAKKAARAPRKPRKPRAKKS